METRQQSTSTPIEDDEYVNGVHESELPPPWTPGEKLFFKNELMDLLQAGKLTKGSTKDIKANLDKAVAGAATYNRTFEK